MYLQFKAGSAGWGSRKTSQQLIKIKQNTHWITQMCGYTQSAVCCFYSPGEGWAPDLLTFFILGHLESVHTGVIWSTLTLLSTGSSRVIAEGMFHREVVPNDYNSENVSRSDWKWTASQGVPWRYAAVQLES